MPLVLKNLCSDALINYKLYAITMHNLAVGGLVIAPDGQMLMIKRALDGVHKPGAWEFPSGRLEEGEGVIEGLKREVLEETGLRVTIYNPISVHEFKRDDGQRIVLIVFLCKSRSKRIKLSHEHIDFEWVKPEKCFGKLFGAYHKEVRCYLQGKS
jgi:8-oxo-dGTP diphosphatase